MLAETSRWRVISTEPVPPVSIVSVPEKVEKIEGIKSIATPGQVIADERRRQGMSLDRLAELTKISQSQLELIESDEFERFSGSVFVKGFLRCCSRALKLDEEHVLGLLYERERETMRLRRREQLSLLAAQPPVSPSPRLKIQRSEFLGTSAQASMSNWISNAVDFRLPPGRVAMWAAVGLLVAAIVLFAFTLASVNSIDAMRS